MIIISHILQIVHEFRGEIQNSLETRYQVTGDYYLAFVHKLPESQKRLLFPLVGPESFRDDSPLTKGVRGLFFRKIPEKPE